MKTILKFYVPVFFCSITLCWGQQVATTPAPTPYAIVSRDANSRVWESTTYETSPLGQAIPQVHRYTELATGLCYQQNGQWVDSQESINILPDGSAEAIQGQHQAYFPADIGNGVIKLVTPDGLTLQSQPIGLSYDDGTNTVLIAELTNSIGQLISSNQIIYTNAFIGVDADLLYTYRKGGFEQDVIFRQQPPAPEQFGLSSADTRLQMLTEFFNPPTPGETVGPVNPQDGLQDTTLGFGAMEMVQGRAFLIGSDEPQINLRQISVYKSWVNVDGRTLLIEQVPYQRISAQLSTLPIPSATTVSSANAILRKASLKRLLPPQRLVEASTNVMQYAKAEFKQNPGLVFDYVTLDSEDLTNYTFQGDTTYYISGYTLMSGTTILEGGAVIKCNEVGGLGIATDGGAIDCQTAPYRPAVFTSKNDNSIGEGISGSTGSPNFEDVGMFFNVGTTNISFSNIRFCYAWQAIQDGPEPNTYDISDCQFLNVAIPVAAYDVGLYNVLIGYSADEASEINGAQDPEIFLDGNLIAENVTSDSGYSFVFADNLAETIALTNCIFTSQTITNNGGAWATVLTNSVVYLPSPTVPIYQVVGGGNYYLTNNSPYRQAGTTNIDLILLSDLAQKTTYPPIIVYSNVSISVSTTLGPAVQRDNTGKPDIGYHYDPLDYAFGGCDLYSNLTFTAGTAVAWYEGSGSSDLDGGYGFTLNDGADLSFNGTATEPCYFAQYQMVQESGNGNWPDSAWMLGIIFNGDNQASPPILSGNFSKWTSAYGMNIFQDAQSGSAAGAGTFKNSEFYDNSMTAFTMQYLYFTNCLFFRDVLAFWDWGYDLSFNFENCTFYNGGVAMVRSGYPSSFWQVENSSFDGTALWWSDSDNGASPDTLFEYNAYNTNNPSWETYELLGTPPPTNELEIVDASDVMVTTYNWQTSWFGSFYLPSDSLLIQMGSTTANFVGLYHFTTQTDQTPEGDNIVDIGYHYVATDNNGNPLDSNSDGIPDYLENPEGDGLDNSGEIGWNLGGDLGLTVIITQPRNGSILP
jgi:hypothetical protein